MEMLTDKHEIFKVRLKILNVFISIISHEKPSISGHTHFLVGSLSVSIFS